MLQILRERIAATRDVDQHADAAVLIAITREPEPKLILTVRAGHILLTPRGWRVANRVWGALWNDD